MAISSTRVIEGQPYISAKKKRLNALFRDADMMGNTIGEKEVPIGITIK